MYCTQCGKPGAGNFCGFCGTSLLKDMEPTAISDHWSNEHRYEVLIQVPEVRRRIADHASRARATMTAEEFLQMGDKLLSPLTGGVPVGKLAAFVQPIYAKLGIRTGRQREEVFAQPIGEVLAAALCALAGAGQKIRGVQQADDGCELEAILPSDLFSFAGDVVVRLTNRESGTRLVAATNVPGQLYDWGKSDRCLDDLLREIRQTLSGMAGWRGESSACRAA